MPDDRKVVTVEEADVRAVLRLIEGMSLPMDMQEWRNGLVRRLTRALDAPDELGDQARRAGNAEAVLYAYKAHHEAFHAECNITGPKPSPRTQERPYA